MISTTQGTFLLDYLITDNILVAYEVMHTKNNRRRDRKGQLSLKFDVNKAYENVIPDGMTFSQMFTSKTGIPNLFS